jgi:membrane-bound ClpP family serine protease
MRYSLPCLCLLVVLGSLTGMGQALDSGHINLVQIQDSINPGVKDFLEHAIQQSAEENAECLIILLDTPGGLMTSMRSMVQDILNAPLPVVVYVSPAEPKRWPEYSPSPGYCGNGPGYQHQCCTRLPEATATFPKP